MIVHRVGEVVPGEFPFVSFLDMPRVHDVLTQDAFIIIF